MKTSTKIFMGLAAAAVAVCVVNVFVVMAMHKTRDAEARRILAQLDAGPIRVFEMTLMPDLDPDVAQSIRGYWNSVMTAVDTDRQRLYVAASALESVRIDGETLRMEVDSHGGNRMGIISMMLTSGSLEKIVIHEAGREDEVIEITSQSEPEAEQHDYKPEPALKPGH